MWGERERERKKRDSKLYEGNLCACVRGKPVCLCASTMESRFDETVDVSVRRIGGKYSINCPRESITSK